MKYFALNIIIALAIGFFIWYVGLWSAGDAKLYVAFVALLPFYKDVFLLLIVNTILPLFFYFVVLMFFKSGKKEKKESLKRVLNPMYVPKLLLSVFSLAWISSMIFGLVRIDSNYFFSIIMMLILGKIIAYLAKKVKIESWHVLAAVAAGRFLLQFQYMDAMFWWSFVLLTIGYGLIRMFVFDLGIVFTNKVKIKDLKEGMIPAELITRDYQKIRAEPYAMSEQGTSYVPVGCECRRLY